MYNKSFWFDIRIYLAVIAALLMIIVFYNPYAGALGGVVLLATYKYSRDRYAERGKELSSYLNSISCQANNDADNALRNVPMAIVIVNEKGFVHWRNNILGQWFDCEVNPGDSFLKLFPGWEPEKLLAKIWNIKEGEWVTLERKTHIYHISPKIAMLDDTASTDNKLVILYITDVTDIELLKVENKNCRPVLGYIQIDNYDDALKGLTENQRAAILGKVNEHLANWVVELDGFLKKFSDDTYSVVFDRRALDKLMSTEKFEILDKVRAIHGGNKIPITLSMGIAAGSLPVASLGHAAQAGLELALGRGGDQAAVDIDGKFKFYGGKSQAVEKNTRVRARIVAQTLRELIDQADMALVMGHSEEDFDSLGAALGIARMVRHTGKTVYIVISKPGIASNKLSEILLDYENYSDTFISTEKAQEIINSRTLLFIVDTHRPELVAAPALLEHAQRRVVIDHHRRAETFIEHPLLVYLEPSASSTSELVAELLSYFSDKIDLTQVEASVMYAGIVLDTKNFTVQTGVRTFDAASYLRRAGADPILVRNMFKTDLNSFKCRAAIVASAETPFEGIAVSVCPPMDKNSQHIVVAQAADTILSIEGMRASFVLFEADGEVGVSARSQGEINVQVVMEQLGGGGHQSAAGVRIKDKPLGEIKDILITTISNYLQESVKKNESNSTTGS